ncbi:hypothetical protein GCM10022199_09910 [Marihabitans asiaticum]|uniref:Alpha/beta hydrolase family protein n=1 Tax=Marihabitans asiaticum TaxID=415218 RepID=A0A560WHH4_9MICO|nr:alpha/beta hydrolase [Marihabitans asiaticum]TWD17010.1 alpha/beta hydrolase family protein [Marihabitans asiaticum]
MTLTHGADTEALRRSAVTLDRLAQRGTTAGNDVARAGARLRDAWQGPDAADFAARSRAARRDIEIAVDAIRIAARDLRGQAEAQEKASTGSTAGAFVGGGFGGPASQRSGATSGGAASPRPLDQLTPPASGSAPVDNATWWAGLMPAERASVLAAHPEWLGNRDGIPFDVRDQANRAYLPVLRADLEAQRAALTQGGDDAVANWVGVGDQYRWLQERWDGAETWLSGDPLIRSELDDKIASLDAVERTAALPDRQLVELDASRDRMEAAISVGNMQTADHVAVFTPGLTSTVQGSLEGYDGAMASLRTKAMEDLRAAGRGDESIATVTWIGYQAPQLDGSVVFGEDRSVTSNAMAREGGVQLAAFDDGIVAARPGDDPHLTNLGHSYGSTTTSSGLQRTESVDDAVLFGSPGPDSGWRDWFLGSTPDHRLDQQHIYVLENDRDVVADLEYFGRDPSRDPHGYTHLSTQDSDYGHRTIGHSSYLEERSTSQHNMSQVVIGGTRMVQR